MKNFTVKKVALGLLLAGYAASSAFAIGGTTQAVIAGNAPVMKADDSSAEHTMAVSFKRDGRLLTSNDTLKVNDTIHIQYKLIDADGDTDTSGIKDSLKVFVRDTNNQWVTVPVTASATYNNDGVGEISFAITNDFAGKTEIGFKILERTDFGYPLSNQWITVSDIFASNPPDVTPTDPTNPGPGPDNPGNPTDPTGPGKIDPNHPGRGPIESDSYQVYIYKLDAVGNLEEAVDYATTAVSPKYGEKFAVVVKDTADNGDYTSRYTYEWYVTGAYEGVNAADAVALSGAYNRVGVSDAILLGSDSGDKHNSLYSTDYKAGIQGYKLAVRTK
jgi:hypothetical protein